MAATATAAYVAFPYATHIDRTRPFPLGRILVHMAKQIAPALAQMGSIAFVLAGGLAWALGSGIKGAASTGAFWGAVAALPLVVLGLAKTVYIVRAHTALRFPFNEDALHERARRAMIVAMPDLTGLLTHAHKAEAYLDIKWVAEHKGLSCLQWSLSYAPDESGHAPNPERLDLPTPTDATGTDLLEIPLSELGVAPARWPRQSQALGLIMTRVGPIPAGSAHAAMAARAAIASWARLARQHEHPHARAPQHHQQNLHQQNRQQQNLHQQDSL